MKTTTLKKVIGFDSWTGGVSNFERIAREFTERGWDFFVVHISSWDRNAPVLPMQHIDGVEYRDISYYATNRLDAVLEAESPDAVVFLSVDTFAHRAFNRLALKRNISTLHLYHGLVSVQDINLVSQYKVNWLAQTRFILERIPKALRFIWPAYVSAMQTTSAKASDWNRFIGDIAVMVSGRRPYKAAPDARTTRCCVYTSADVSHATHRYGFQNSEVVPVGNPDLERFGLLSDDIGSRLECASGDEVMYIDTGLVYTGYVFASYAQFVRHLIETRDVLADQGLRLLFKPHPQHERSGLLETLETEGIALCFREAFVPRLRSCRAAIVEPSTLSIVPALMGLPLLLNQCGALTGQRYGPVLTSYPRHVLLQDLARCLVSIEQIECESSLDAARSWIASNAGPLPSEGMPARVADLVAELVAASSGKPVQ